MFSGLIDSFIGLTGPISSGGNWLDLLEQGVDDVLVANESPFFDVAGHRHSAGLGSTAGPGHTLRIVSPGLGYTQEIAGFSQGVRGDVNMLCRYSLDGQRGYRAEFREGVSFGTMDIVLKRIDAGVATTLGSVTVSGDSGTNGYQGVHAEGDVIDVYHWPFGGSPILALSCTDATYASGYLGIGNRGGLIGGAQFSDVYGFSDPTNPADVNLGRGLVLAPFTFQYSNDPAHVIAA